MSKKKIPHQDYISFTKEMKKDYKILVPMMLQMHWRLHCVMPEAIHRVFRRQATSRKRYNDIRCSEEGIVICFIIWREPLWSCSPIWLRLIATA